MDIIIGSQFPKKVIPLIEAAKNSIEIIVFDWRWYPNDPGSQVSLFNQAIIRAKRRNVNVRVITNIPEVVNILKREGIDAKKLLTPNLVHIKMMVIDDSILIIGSHNYTQNAFTMNFEVSIIVEDSESIATLKAFFNNLFF